jgi:rhodanese-related sulfurtransferase
MDNLELGLFQLENLIHARSPFLFFNLSEHDVQASDPKLASYLKTAIVIHPDRLLEHLKSQKVDPQYPIVVMCDDGVISREAATALGKKGFGQVYIIEGGYQGLVKEAESF